MDKALASKILDAVEKLNKPIEHLGEELNGITDLDERRRYRRFLGEIMASLELDITHPIRHELKGTVMPSYIGGGKQPKDHTNTIISGAENLQDDTSALILAIDSIENEDERRALRRSFAELKGFSEDKFVFEIRMLRKE